MRFNIDENEKSHGGGGGGKEGRSSSLESHFRAPQPPPGSPAPRPARERHRSGGGGGGGIGLKGDPNTERTLRDIDKDIHKIWRELQQLDTISANSNSNPPPTRGATAVRKISPTPPSSQATPVKIRDAIQLKKNWNKFWFEK